MPKINRIGGNVSTRPGAPEGINAADRANILKMIANELRKGGDDFSTGRGRITPKYMVRPPGGHITPKYMVQPPGGHITPKYMVQPPGGHITPKYMVQPPGGHITPKYMVQPPKPGPGDMVPMYMVQPPMPGPGDIAPKYMVRPPKPGPGDIAPMYMVRPPKPGPGDIAPMYMVRPPGGGIVAKYMVVPPGIVPMYIAPAPWAGLDAHQAVINKVTADGKVSKKEGVLVRKLFNRDIAEAGKEGRDIRGKVASYLHKVFDRLQLDKTAKNLIFGAGGPGYTKPIIAPKYMVVRPE